MPPGVAASSGDVAEPCKDPPCCPQLLAFRFLKQLLERRGVGPRRHAAIILEGQAWRAAQEGGTVGT